MSKTYLIVLSPNYNRDEVQKFVESDPRVSFWFYSLPGSIFVTTTMSAKELSMLVMKRFGEHRHFVTEVTDNRWGILPKDHWQHFEKYRRD